MSNKDQKNLVCIYRTTWIIHVYCFDYFLKILHANSFETVPLNKRKKIQIKIQSPMTKIVHKTLKAKSC